MTRTSILNDKEALADALATSSSIKEALEKLNLRAAGGNYKNLKTACQKFDLKIPVWDYSTTLKPFTRFPDEQIFVENSSYANRNEIKKRMFAMGIPNILQ